ncbi:apoptosis-associated speck-like protein containing a CARD [Salmo trutta]|uniref:Receptor-interacting serine/threonine-protein kinase 3-like n=1 Tax=Salmo trutta TaxID=8032 RepID=A0A674BH85_SALTR|nr:apoptosis-associated speck-like protein containing a CARD [Salmo trutta]XP_029552356.1 apoptosis-associated speck-like protein containing a CARD [Salmo trutta]
MATPVPQRLLATLEKLDKATFDTFQWNLMEETLEGFTPMSIANLEDASRHKTVSKMVQAYKKEGAMKITQKILEKMGMIDLADKLKTDVEKDQAATPQSSQDQSAVMETKQYGAKFVDENMEVLIQRITMVMPIADGLYQKKMIHDEDYSEITAAPTSMSKMRKLYVALKPGGAVAKSAFYKILLEQQSLLVKELGGVGQK